ncbi:MAG: type II secretion system protein N [Magnetococcus sp. YQC-5]
MITFRHYATWGVLCYGVFLVVSMPAQWVVGLVSPYLTPIHLTGISGSIWSGGIQTIELGKLRVGPGQWRVRLTSLLRGRLGLDFSVGEERIGPYLQGRGGLIGGTALFLEGLTFQMAMVDVRNFVPMVPSESKGRIQGRLEELVVNRSGVLALRGRGEVIGLFIGSPLNLEVGDFTGEASTGDDRGVLLRLADRKGPWRLQATVRIQPDGQYRLRGVTSLGDPSNERLAGYLRMLGPLDSMGRVHLNESGRLPGFS